MMKRSNNKYCFVVRQNETIDEIEKSIREYTKTKELNEYNDLNNTEMFIEPPYSFHNVLQLLNMNMYHKACCEVIAADVAGAGFNIVSKENEYNEDNRDILESFFEKNNISELIRKAEFDLEALGFCVIEICRENGSDSDVVELNHMNPLHFKMHIDKKRVIQKIGTKERWFVLKGKNYDEYGRHFEVNCKTGEIVYKKLAEDERANEIVWLTRYSTEQSPYGFCSALPALNCILNDYAREKFNSKFFRNYGMPSFAIALSGNFDSDSTEELATEIKDALQNIIEEPFSSLVLQVPSESEEGKVDINIQPLSTTPSEASFLQFRKQNRDDIISAHRVDPSRLSIYEAGSLNGTNSIQLDSAYFISVIKPYRAQITNVLNSLIVDDFEFDDLAFEIFDNATSAEQKAIENVLKLVDSAIMTINEAREYLSNQFNIDPVEDEIADELCYHGRPLTEFGMSTNFFYDDDEDDEEVKELEE